MTPLEKLRAWKDDAAEHALIWCYDWTPDSRGLKAQCETCGRDISAWPVVLNKIGPFVHIVCQRNCMPIALSVNGAIPFGGRICDNALPESLTSFKGGPR